LEQFSVGPQIPSPQSSGQEPQSSGQLVHVSSPLQTPSPHPGQGPQSALQMEHDSSKLQMPSPQTPSSPLILAFEHPAKMKSRASEKDTMS